MLRLRFTFLGEEQVDRSLTRFERVADMRPAWALLRERFRVAEDRQFASQGRGSWPPLSRVYGAWKARHFPGRPLMVREDELRRSLVDGPEIDIEEPSYAIFGTAVPYAVFHQRGAGRLPQRKVIDLDETERQEWVRTVQRWLVEEAEA